MPTFHELLITVIATAFAGAIYDLLKYALRSESILVSWARPTLGALPFRRSMIDVYRTKGPEACAHRLVKWLVRDQFIAGRMKGQFGRSQAAEEQQRFKGDEAPTGRPRLYQSSWACFVLTKHQLARRQMNIARRGIERLLAKGLIRAVVHSQQPDTNKVQSSIRHSIRAGHTLWALDRSSLSAVRVAKRMLDPGEKWQSDAGGWYQLSERRNDPDLWASVYAADYLDALLAETPDWLDADTARASLRKTLKFLRDEWSQEKWAYSGSSPEENVPQVLTCLSTLLQREAPDLLKEIAYWNRPWFTPAGDLSTSYVESCPIVPLATGAVRFGHYVFSIQRENPQWRRLLMQAIEGFQTLRSAADIAMMLDLMMAAASEPTKSLPT